MLEYLLEIQDGAAGDVLLVQNSHPLSHSSLAQPAVHDLGEGVAMHGPLPGRRKAWVSPQVPQIEPGAQATKGVLWPGRDIDIPILGFKCARWT
jgi:hypothetical protein